MRQLKWLLVTLLFSVIGNISGQQIVTETSGSLESLIQANFGQGCVDISNVSSSVNGQIVDINSYGSFQKGESDFPFENGVVLSTGSIQSAGNGLNALTLNEGNPNWPTDADLESTLGINNTLNATSIEFDFISATSQISFNYILASEEYISNFPCQYSDGFAFLIKKVESNDPFTNIALVPGTPFPVNTTTIRPEIVGFCPPNNDEFFEGYNIGDTNYNGRTTILTATANIEPYAPYRIKLIIADQTDQNYDSAVFIEGTATIASVDLGPDIATCAQTALLNGFVNNDLATYQWYRDGNLIPGAEGPQYLTAVSGTYSLEVSIPINNEICMIEDEVVVNLTDEQPVEPISDFIVCDDISNDGQATFDLSEKTPEVLDAVPDGNYDVSYHLTPEDAASGAGSITDPFTNTTNPQTIYVRVDDTDNGCLGFSTINLVVNPSPFFNPPEDINVCDDNSDGIANVSLEPTTLQIWDDNPNVIVSYFLNPSDAEIGLTPIPQPYTTSGPSDVLYIRIEDSITGCVAVTPLQITVNLTPELNPEIQYINACETDDDGFEIFNITSVTDNILQGLTNVSVEFFETQIDAQEGINPIPNPSAYQNAIPEFQIVYIRVTDDSTGCFSIMPIELHTNVVETGFISTPFGVCDDESNDGIAEFDLGLVETRILAQYVEWEIEFFETEDDMLNNVNAIDKSVPYTTTSITTTLYFSATLDDCTQYDTIDLIIHPAIEIQPLGTVTFCDEDFDGFTTIDLNSYYSYVSTGIPNANVRYYDNEMDAINGVGQIPFDYDNPTNPVTVYCKVTNVQTGCFDVAPLEILVIDPPVVSQPSDIIICDDDQDGFYIVNLESKIPEIVTDTTDLTFSFHETFDDANIGSNFIDNAINYNTDTRTVFVRVESLITTCHSIVELNIIVNTLPVLVSISEYEACESDGDGFNEFLFNTKDEEILNDQSGKEVLYFETEEDAINRNNPIDKDIAYGNQTNPQTIFVRVENITDINCFDTTSFQIVVTQFVTYNQPADINICDDASNDGIGTFNLNDKIAEITDGINIDLDLSFHPSFIDADLNANELPLEFTNSVNPQTIYVRIENELLCPAIASFNINIIQVPDINPAPDQVYCDDDFDGITNFDLTIVETDVLDVRIDDIEIFYFESLENLEDHVEAIEEPSDYSNLTNPQTIYIKVLNRLSNCYNVETVELTVNLPPLVNDFINYDICFDPSNSFQLDEIDSVIVNDSTDVLFSYYSTFEEAEISDNPLDLNYTYTSNSDTIYARVEFLTTGCFYVYPFQLIVNPLPVANEPEDLEACDDDTNDLVEIFNLELVTPQVLGSQDPDQFSVNYYSSLDNAHIDFNPLDLNFVGVDGQTIFARIENNVTGCYALTQFDLIVNPHPFTPAPLVNCDDDYDGITTFDLTLAEPELFTEINPDNIHTYFETLSDLQTDSNPIGNPQNYTNLSNPQTVFIKVFNTVADCYTFVPLELQVNLPPAINAQDSFEVCETDAGVITLSDINDELLLQTPNVIVTYYATQSDALNQVNALDNDYTYQSFNDTIFARIEFSTTRCYHIHEFTLLVNPLPVANPLDNMIACDNDFDGFFPFDFAEQNIQLLGTQEPSLFEITYYNNLISAEQGLDELELPYLADNNEIIYVRIENIITGCYDLTSFITIVHPKPFVDIDDQVICLENLPLYVDAETFNPQDTYLWSTGATTSEIEITQIGTYSVTVTSENGCQTFEEFIVSESEEATIEVTESIDFSDPNNVIVTVSGIGNYLYQLDDNDPQVSNVFTNVSLGYHLLTIIDLNGCTSATKEIVVIDAPKFMTPNGDGHFDTWHITGVETLPGTVINIFDRYGKLLKTLTSETPGWNGYYNGSLMPVSDYWYVASVRRGPETFQVKGHFSLRY